MSLLNKEAYTVTPDKLIYDSKHPIDSDAIAVSLGEGAASDGTISRGQVIDVSSGTYSVHANGGTPSAIAAEDTDYAEGATSVIVPVYTSGSFRESEVIADPALTEQNIETLRDKGIFLK